MKASKLTLTSSVAKSEEKQIKSLNSQFSGILKKELNSDWKVYSNSLSQVVKFLLDESNEGGKYNFIAFCENENFSLPPNFDGSYLIRLYKSFGENTVKSLKKENKGEIVPKIRYSANDFCKAVKKSLKG
jgi:hypothetical protein